MRDPVQTGAVLFLVVAIGTILVLFMRSRKREGVGLFEISDKDKAEFRETGSEIAKEFAPRRLVGQLLATLGSLLVMAGFYPTDSIKWSTTFGMFFTGVGLILAGGWLAKPGRPRPRYWWPALWGMVTSSSLLLLLVCAVYIVRTPANRIPNWVRDVVALLVVVALPSALCCIIAGVRDAIGSRKDTHAEEPQEQVNRSVP